MDGAEERWAAVAELAAGFPDKELRGRRRRVLIGLAGILALTLAAGLTLGLLLPLSRPGSTRADADVASDLYLLGLTYQGLGLLVGIVGFLWAKKTGRYITRWRAIVSPLNGRERRAVMKQIRGRIGPDPQRMDSLLAIAKQQRAATLGVAPLFTGLALIGTGGAISTDLDIARWLQLIGVAFFLLAFVLMTRDYRQMGRFLDRYDHAVLPESADQ